MARIGGTCYFKIDGQQLSLTGGIEVPMNRTVNDDIIGPGRFSGPQGNSPCALCQRDFQGAEEFSGEQNHLV